jgi:hypothetical protein
MLMELENIRDNKGDFNAIEENWALFIEQI